MSQRFVDCGLTALLPNDGTYTEYTEEKVTSIKDAMSNSWLPAFVGREVGIVFEALFVFIAGAYTTTENDEGDEDISDPFDHLYFGRFDVHQFPRLFEKGNRKAYDIFRVTLFDKHSTAYQVYVVVDVSPTFCEGRNEGVEGCFLRGISFPMPNLVPEYGWCNEEKNWFYWNETVTSKNKELEASL
jgi:hypothetical protein